MRSPPTLETQPHAETLVKALLVNTPSPGRSIARDMAGGLGFDVNASTLLPPLDLLTYATVLRNSGAEVELSDAETCEEAELLGRFATLRPDAIITTLSLPTLQEDAAFARRLRTATGGAKLAIKTNVREEALLLTALREAGAELAITGECDLTIRDILEDRQTAGTARLVGGGLQMTPEAVLGELDQLPIIDRPLLPVRYRYPRLGENIATLQTSRGCPFKCGYYCPYPLVQGKKWRAMSAERVLAELTVIGEQGYDGVLFRDATFTLDRRRALAIASGLRERALPLKWWCETRVDCLDRELLTAMRDAGCVGLNIGIETGDEALIASQGKPGVTILGVQEVANACRELGLRIHFLLMLGLPGESRGSLLSTMRLVNELRPQSLGVTTVTPYPGTPLHRDALKHGWIVKGDADTLGGHGYNLQIGELGPAELQFVKDRIHALGKLVNTASAAATEERERLLAEVGEWARPSASRLALPVLSSAQP